MQRRILYLGLAVLLAGASPAVAQSDERDTLLGVARSDERDTLLGVNLAGPLFGIYSGSFQQLLQNDLSIFVRGTYFDQRWNVVDLVRLPEDWTYWSVDAEIGANYYPQDAAPSGFYAGVGFTPSYLFLRDKPGEDGTEAAGLRLGVVTQVGYQFVWGPIALGPRASMGHQWVLADLSDLDDENVENENGIKGVVSGFWLGVGLDLSVAF